MTLEEFVNKLEEHKQFFKNTWQKLALKDKLLIGGMIGVGVLGSICGAAMVLKSLL